MIKIMIDRDSVCMGDDVLPHKMECELPDNISVAEFINFLNNKHYIPSIQGNNVAWGLCNNGEEIFVYFTQKDSVSHATLLLSDVIEKTGNDLFVLIYYTSPEKYLEKRDNKIHENCRL